MGKSPSSWETLDSSEWRRYSWREAAGSASLENLISEVMKGERMLDLCRGDLEPSQKLVMSLPTQLSLPTPLWVSETTILSQVLG